MIGRVSMDSEGVTAGGKPGRSGEPMRLEFTLGSVSFEILLDTEVEVLSGHLNLTSEEEVKIEK